MYKIKPTRRDFLMGTAGAGLVAIAQAAAPTLFAAQAQAVNGFNNLKAYGVKLYEETDAHNYIYDEKRRSSRSRDVPMEFPYLFNGETDDRKVRVLVHKELPSGPYSLEAKVYSKGRDVELPNGWAGFDENIPSSVFFDHGFKGNLRGRMDIATNFALNNETMEYGVFMGDGGYYFAHFISPAKLQYVSESQAYEEIRKRINPILDGLTKLKFSERDIDNLMGIFTSFDGINSAGGHIPNFMASILDGIAWYSPSGTLQTYWDSSLGNRKARENVGKQPRLIGSYSRTAHAELQRRREQAIANGNKQNWQILQMTIDNLVSEGKISLQ